ncbi:MAG TPA: MarR family transcriptional regulator [Thermoplasmata archaeon]|nr:MarR family transcriptional regulator [Thermoplasmata archaeon]
MSLAANSVIGSAMLDHPTRRLIYRHLLLLPGDHFRAIVRSLRLGHGTASHHLDMLVRSGLLVSERTNGRRRYYAKGDESESERNQLYTKHWNYRDLRLRILFALDRTPKARPGELARLLGISRQLVAYHLSRLVELGMIKRENGRYWQAVPRRRTS